jgi:hypothetical protein
LPAAPSTSAALSFFPVCLAPSTNFAGVGTARGLAGRLHHSVEAVSSAIEAFAVAGMCRFTRLTNAFSKKVENHAHAVALHMMYYNFVRIHKTLKVTPAMAPGVTKRLWEMKDIFEMLEAWEVVQSKF